MTRPILLMALAMFVLGVGAQKSAVGQAESCGPSDYGAIRVGPEEGDAGGTFYVASDEGLWHGVNGCTGLQKSGNNPDVPVLHYPAMVLEPFEDERGEFAQLLVSGAPRDAHEATSDASGTVTIAMVFDVDGDAWTNHGGSAIWEELRPLITKASAFYENYGITFAAVQRWHFSTPGEPSTESELCDEGDAYTRLDDLETVWQQGSNGEQKVVRDFVIMFMDGINGVDGCALEGGIRAPYDGGYADMFLDAYNEDYADGNWRELSFIHETAHLMGGTHEDGGLVLGTTKYDPVSDVAFTEMHHPPVFTLANAENVKSCTTNRASCP